MNYYLDQISEKGLKLTIKNLWASILIFSIWWSSCSSVLLAKFERTLQRNLQDFKCATNSSCFFFVQTMNVSLGRRKTGFQVTVYGRFPFRQWIPLGLASQGSKQVPTALSSWCWQQASWRGSYVLVRQHFLRSPFEFFETYLKWSYIN